MNPIQSRIHAFVQEYGIAIQRVFPTKDDDTPEYLYTIGMTNIGAPEIIVFGLDPNMMLPILNQIFSEMRSGVRNKGVEYIDDVLSVPVLLHEVRPLLAPDFLTQALEYYRETHYKPTFKQMVWPDAEGIYPHQKGFNERLAKIQPYIGIIPKPKEVGRDIEPGR